jgi:hypothetical protein
MFKVDHLRGCSTPARVVPGTKITDHSAEAERIRGPWQCQERVVSGSGMED